MSKRRHRPSRSGRSIPPPAGGRPQGLPRKRRWLGAAILLASALGGAVALWLFLKPGVPDLPAIPMAQLDEPSQRLIQKHLEQVRNELRSGHAWGKLGAILRSYEFRTEAAGCLQTAERLDPREPRWPYLQGLLALQSAPEDAIPRIRRAVALCGNEPDAPRLRLATLLAERGEWEAAHQELEQVLRANPNHGLALMGLARIAQARGDLTNAMALASRCLKDGRSAHAAWTLLAVLRQRLGDTNGAQEALRMTATLAPVKGLLDPFEAEAAALRGDRRMLSEQAQQFLMAGQAAEAAPLVNRLVQEHPDFGQAWLLLGRWQILGRQFAAAEQSLRRHLDIGPPTPGGYFQLGLAMQRQERFAEAASWFEKAIELKPDFGPACFNLGVCLAQAGRKRDAVAPFRAAIRHSPEYIDSYILLADLHLQLAEKSIASELYEQARLLNPADRRLPVLLEKIGWQ